MIVSASAGISFVRCCHSGMVGIAQLTAMDGTSDCDMPMSSDCMQVTILKLVPSDVAQQSIFNFTQLYHLVALPTSTWAWKPLLSATNNHRRLAFIDFHSPPRAYLRRLRLLLI